MVCFAVVVGFNVVAGLTVVIGFVVVNGLVVEALFVELSRTEAMIVKVFVTVSVAQVSLSS